MEPGFYIYEDRAVFYVTRTGRTLVCEAVNPQYARRIAAAMAVADQVDVSALETGTAYICHRSKVNP